MKNDSSPHDVNRGWLRAVLLACCAFTLVSCIGGHRFLLSGHAPGKSAGPLAPLVLQQGENRLIVCEWGRPMKWGFSPGLACADETVARVEYEDGRPSSGTVFLRGLKPGVTRAWYVNGFVTSHSQTVREDESRDMRTSFEVHVLPPRRCAEMLLPHP